MYIWYMEYLYICILYMCIIYILVFMLYVRNIYSAFFPSLYVWYLLSFVFWLIYIYSVFLFFGWSGGQVAAGILVQVTPIPSFKNYLRRDLFAKSLFSA